LRGARFLGSDLRGADFRGAKFDQGAFDEAVTLGAFFDSEVSSESRGN